MKLTASHVDTCLPSYWGGHHRPHIQVPVHREMTLKGLKEELINELHTGCVMGAEAPAEDDEEWFRQARIAVSNIKAKVQDTEPLADEDIKLFLDLEPDSEDDDGQESVYAFFLFLEEGE